MHTSRVTTFRQFIKILIVVIVSGLLFIACGKSQTTKKDLSKYPVTPFKIVTTSEPEQVEINKRI